MGALMGKFMDTMRGFPNKHDRMVAEAEKHGYAGGMNQIGTSMRHPSGHTLDVYHDGSARHIDTDEHDTDQYACAHDRCAHVTHVYNVKQLRDTLTKAHPKATTQTASADSRISARLRGR